MTKSEAKTSNVEALARELFIVENYQVDPNSPAFRCAEPLRVAGGRAFVVPAYYTVPGWTLYVTAATEALKASGIEPEPLDDPDCMALVSLREFIELQNAAASHANESRGVQEKSP